MDNEDTIPRGDVHVDSDISEAAEIVDEFEPQRGDLDEDSGEDLFGDNYLDDYRRGEDEGDDQLDPDHIDDRQHNDMNAGQRARAEAEMRLREQQAAGTRTQPARRADAFYNIGRLLGADDGEDEREEARARRRRQRRVQILDSSQSCAPQAQIAQDAYDELPYYESGIKWSQNYENCISIILENFLWRYTDSEAESNDDPMLRDVGMYVEELVNLVREDRTSLKITYNSLLSELIKLHEWFAFLPMKMFEIFDQAANKIVGNLYGDLYKGKHIRVRVVHFSDWIQPMTSLKTETLNILVAVEGVVVKRSGILPKIKELFLKCKACDQVTGPVEMKEDEFTTVREKRVCARCQGQNFEHARERMTYQNLQYLTIQEVPSAVVHRRAPCQKEVLVDGDLVDLVRPGDEIALLAYHATRRDALTNTRTGFPILSATLVANNIMKRSDIKIASLKPEEVLQFHKLAKNPQVREKLITSIAPSIWGHRHAKTGLAMSVFGGVRQEKSGSGGKHSVRGDINVLLVGDPGMAKSQLLKYVNKLAEKSIFTTGKGASAAGLTASMKKDPVSGEFSLEGGALVLADTGICLIDEFDKMSEIDRVSIHEAMEAQTISISKAGICTTLRARCSVIAAANPIYGKYDQNLTFTENVTLGDTILSRFDVVAVMKDTPNPVHDAQMAEYILKTHMTSHPDVVNDRRIGRVDDTGAEEHAEEEDFINGDAPIPHAFLAKYIMYAKKHVHPRLTKNDQSKIAEFYAQVRQSAIRSGGLPVTVRHLESILRMSIANAKMRLSNSVSRDDIDYAISTMLESFIQSQKNVVAQNLTKKFGRYRALATNPFEMLENLLSEMLSKQGYQNLQDQNRERVTDEDARHLMGASISIDQFVQFGESFHDLPRTLLNQYMSSNKFKEKFRTGMDANGCHCIFSGPDDEININYQATQSQHAQ